jgi:7-cyano-7-deazaguanine synthase
MKTVKPKAVVLLSGGLDSATTLFFAKAKGYDAHCLIFDYGQRHRKEIKQAKEIARAAGCDYRLVKIVLPWQGSALLDKKIPLPTHRDIVPDEIPATYVPARNIIFLSFAASYAEAIAGRAIFIGANAVDYSGYPDCRPEFLASYEEMLRRGLKTGVERKPVKVVAPLIAKTKADIIRLAVRLNVPLALTWSCYRGGQRPCGVCDSCLLRQKGFAEVGIVDPAQPRKKPRPDKAKPIK